MKNITPLVLASIFFLVTIGVYGSALITIDGYVARISNALQDSQTLTDRDARARSIEALLTDTESLRMTLQSFVIKDEDIVSVIELLEDVSQEEDVSLSISSVSVSDVSGWNHHERININFSVDGTFADVTDFLATLEHIPFAVRLESGALGVSRGSSWFGSFTVMFIKEKL